MKKINIKFFLQTIIFSLILNYCHGQSDLSGAVAGHVGASFTTYYCGWDVNTTFDLSILHQGPHSIKFLTDSLQRMIILPGAGANGGYVGIGNNFINPVSRLHVQQGSNQTVWFQMTGNNTNSTANDGLRIGVLNPVNGRYDVEIRQQENAPMNFFTTDSSAIKERLRLWYGRGGNGTGGWNTNGGITKLFISHDGTGANYLPPGVAMLNMGRIGAVNSSGGARPWMDVGTYYHFDSDNMYAGLMDMGNNRKDAVINFGDDPQFNPPDASVQNLRFIFTEFPLTVGADTGSYDGRRTQGLEIARLSAQGNMGIGALFTNTLQPVRRLEIVDDGATHRTHVGGPQLRLSHIQSPGNILTTGIWTDLQTTNRGDLYVHPDSSGFDKRVGINISTPGNTLEINSTALSPKPSGLRFSNLTSDSTSEAPNGKVLTVNGNGDVILTDDVGGGDVVACSARTTNFVTKWNPASSRTICNTIAFDDGGRFGVNTNTSNGGGIGQGLFYTFQNAGTSMFTNETNIPNGFINEHNTNSYPLAVRTRSTSLG